MVNAACTQAADSTSATMSAKGWASADSLFRNNRTWLGGDAAISVDLGAGRTLWLFGDSFIALDSTFSRAKSTMVHNTIAIQRGYDPASASILYYRGHQGGSPAAFFNESGDWYLWPRDGIRIGDRLLIVFARVRAAQGGLGFEEFGWTAALVRNPDDEPAQWKYEFVPAPPPDKFNVATIPATLLRAGEFLYAYMAASANPHTVYLARWPVQDAASGVLAWPRWWTGARTGERAGWRSADDSAAKPLPLFEAQTEFSVVYDSSSRKYMQIQTVGFGAADLAYRSATNLQGPWSALQNFYRPPEFGASNIMIYSARAHPEQQAAGLVVTYNVNSFDFGELVRDPEIYYPKVLIFRTGGPAPVK
jgi:hypothetical protein